MELANSYGNFSQYETPFGQSPISISFVFHWRFNPPKLMIDNEEYLVYDNNTLLGYIGGTLGMFIGISLCSLISIILNYFQKLAN